MHKTCRSSKKGGGILGSCTGRGKRHIRERPRGCKRCLTHSKSNRRNHTQYHQLQNSPLTPSPTPFALNQPGRHHISVQCLPRGKAAQYILLFCDSQIQTASTLFKKKKGKAGVIPSFKPPALSPIHSATVLICMADWTTNYRVEYF